MKYLLLFAPALLMTGCKSEAPPVKPTTGEVKTVSSDGMTWRLGAVTINGTNVPWSNITVGVAPGTNVPQHPAETPK